MIDIEKSSGNVYQDLGFPDAEAMLIKAQLVAKIGEIVKGRKRPHAEAAKVLGITPTRLSTILRGQFHDVGQSTLIEYLTKLGRDVQIVIGPARKSCKPGQISVVYAD